MAVDATAAQSLAGKYDVKGFPTIKFFGGDGKAQEYNGAREAGPIVDFVLGKAKEVAKARLSGKAGSSSGSKKEKASGGSGGSGGGGSGNSKPASETGGGKHVVTLTSDNFDELVFGGGAGAPNAWMIELYAPWCGHCKNLAPEWASAASKLKDDEGVKLGAVDATVHSDLATKFGVKGYPTIKIIPAGAKSADEAKDYNGERKSDAIVQQAQQLAAAAAASGAGKPVKVEQLLSQAQWDEACGGKALCVVAVLPHILDDKASGREARLATLGEAAGKSRGKPYKFFWTEVGAQPKLEAALSVGLVPALFAISAEKKVFITHKGAFSASGVSGFAAGLTTNKGAAGALPLPASADLASAISKVEAWDGKDGKAGDSGDSFSLDELGL